MILSNISKIKKFDTTNGEGIRTSIFFSGCEFNCKGCFNQSIKNFDCGTPYDYKNIKNTIGTYTTGISVLGGEPLHKNNTTDVYKLCAQFKAEFPDKTIWLWTGNTYENLLSSEDTNIKLILGLVDVLIDGLYVEELRDLRLKWRGSSNQRVIDIKESFIQDNIVLYCD